MSGTIEEFALLTPEICGMEVVISDEDFLADLGSGAIGNDHFQLCLPCVVQLDLRCPHDEGDAALAPVIGRSPPSGPRPAATPCRDVLVAATLSPTLLSIYSSQMMRTTTVEPSGQ